MSPSVRRTYPFQFAEGEGFKPPIPERGIPDFESSAIVHSANLPCLIAGAKVVTFFVPAKFYPSFFIRFFIFAIISVFFRNTFSVYHPSAANKVPPAIQ